MRATPRFVGLVLMIGIAVGLSGCGRRVAVKQAPDTQGSDPLTEAAKQEGKSVTVELTASFLGVPRDGIILAEQDPASRDFKGLAVFIPRDSLARFGDANGNDVGERFVDKKIRVAGKVGSRSFEYLGTGENAKLERVERKIIEVTEPGQISVVGK